ncbi:hypothetical protein M885DRAFT_561489 [Pelagophyceae sp. CCMP2097]|nr:hypothetical protein M885DRAFT_561489 [Pelagophyceae sp. CCMP2097]
MDAFVSRLEAALSAESFNGLEGSVHRVDGGLRFVASKEKVAQRELVVPTAEVERLMAAFNACDVSKQKDMLSCACRAYVGGAADVPQTWSSAKPRLLPQLWSLAKIMKKQAELQGAAVVPFCGINGEATVPSGCDLGVVVVCDFSVSGAVCETPVLSRDLQRWATDGDAPCDWTQLLRVAVDNLRLLTKKRETEPNFKRWNHHESGCGSTQWRDRYDAARAALLPSIVAKRKREDGGREPGAHVAVFAARDVSLATTARNALGLCYLGDMLHTQMKPKAGDGLISTIPFRLVKVKMASNAAAHPLVQKAGEGVCWRWQIYRPAASAGEFSVPTNTEEVEALLAAIEFGGPTPVFGETDDARRRLEQRSVMDVEKDAGNQLFAAGEYAQSWGRYDAAISLGEAAAQEGDGEVARPLAIVHANAAAALLKLADVAVWALASPGTKSPDASAKAAQALRHAMRAAQLDANYAKAHARCAAAFTILGETAAAADATRLAEECTVRDKAAATAKRAVEVEKRNVELAKRAAVVEKKRLAAEAKLKLADAADAARRAKADAKKAAALKAAAPKATITLDDGAALAGIAGLEGLVPNAFDMPQYDFSSALPPRLPGHFDASQFGASKLSPGYVATNNVN